MRIAPAMRSLAMRRIAAAAAWASRPSGAPIWASIRAATLAQEHRVTVVLNPAHTSTVLRAMTMDLLNFIDFSRYG